MFCFSVLKIHLLVYELEHQRNEVNLRGRLLERLMISMNNLLSKIPLFWLLINQNRVERYYTSLNSLMLQVYSRVANIKS